MFAATQALVVTENGVEDSFLLDQLEAAALFEL